MKGRRNLSRLLLCLLFLLYADRDPTSSSPSSSCEALPLSTSSRWIVDDATGRRVKLACVNWASHVDVMIAEGLNRQPLDSISKKISSLGFNCVRLTWPLFLFTHDSLTNLTVRLSLLRLNLIESVAGFHVHNPELLDLTLIQALMAVVTNLGDNSVMVILDNHISKAGWCCSIFDGNGFFNDRYFDPEAWTEGLSRVAAIFNATDSVVGMSLRNELRGPRQSVKEWYRYMRMGAEAVHSAKPNALVIISGLAFDTDLAFLNGGGGRIRGLNLSFTGKVVFELHWYGFTEGHVWENGNPNLVCGQAAGNFRKRGGFLLTAGEERYPLFLSEFGVDERGVNWNDNRYLNCLVGVLAETDMDWAFWVLQGSYYVRQGMAAMEEMYGLLDWNWCGLRNDTLYNRIATLQAPFRGPGLSQKAPRRIMFHPLTGLCIQRKSNLVIEILKLGSCSETDSWTYTPDHHHLVLRGNQSLCIKATAPGKPVKLGLLCSEDNTTSWGNRWEKISDSGMHFATNFSDGTLACLDFDPDANVVVTNVCKCIGRNQKCDPASQWFKMVISTRERSPGTSSSSSLLSGVVSSGEGSSQEVIEHGEFTRRNRAVALMQ